MQGYLYTEMLFQKDAFTQLKRFYTQILLHRDDFALRNFTRRCQNKRSRLYKGMHLHEELLHTNDFTQAYFHLISERQTCISRQRVQQADAKLQFHHSFNDRDAFREKGLFEHNQNYNFTLFSTIDAHLAQELTQNHPRRCNFGGPGRDACRGKTSTNPRCNFAPLFDDRHFVRAGCVSRTSIHTALLPYDKISKHC